MSTSIRQHLRAIARTSALAAVLAAAACGGDDGGTGLDRDAEVQTLAAADQAALCEYFFQTVCTGSSEEYCTTCLAADPCDDPGLAASMNAECAGIEVGLVEDCADAAAGLPDGLEPPPSCTSGGGCMFDVGDALCGE